MPAALGDQFQLRWFRFSRRPERIRGLDGLAFAGNRSDLSAALDEVRREMAAMPLAGLVLVTDGADNADSAITRAVLSLTAAGVPVYTVGVGEERYPTDLELSRVTAPRAALRGGSVLVEALVQQQGGGRDSASIVVEEAGRILATRRFALARRRPGRDRQHPGPPGRGRGTPAHGAAAGSSGRGGHAQQRARNPGRGARPRRAHSLLRGRAALRIRLHAARGGGRHQPRVVGLERTAEGKFLRLGVEDSLDLAAGFPRTREELFKYRAVILGSVEASAFTAEQLRMIAEFAGTRGGGLLLLGGRRSFGEGAWHDTPLEDVSPLLLDQPKDTGYFRVLAVEPSAAGRDHPVTQLAWDSLPPVTAVNRVGALKPGATSLLSGRDTAGRGDQPVLAFQRYGRGRVIALPVQDTWHWQMAAQIAVDDQKYETFWRQLLRWLADESPDRLEIAAQVEDLAPGEPVTVEVELRDRTWQPVNDGSVTAQVTDPAGVVTEVPLDWVIGVDGRYRGAFTARAAGEYRIEATSMGADTLSAEPAFVRAGEVSREFFGAGQRAPLLRRIAEETGGKYYTMATAASLPRDIVYTERGITATEQLDLWDMPIVFFLLAGLLAGEWGLRRARGMA